MDTVERLNSAKRFFELVEGTLGETEGLEDCYGGEINKWVLERGIPYLRLDSGGREGLIERKKRLLEFLEPAEGFIPGLDDIIKEILDTDILAVFTDENDPCRKFCDDFPLVCGAGGSVCRGDGICDELYWSDSEIPISGEKVGEISRGVLCDETAAEASSRMKQYMNQQGTASADENVAVIGLLSMSGSVGDLKRPRSDSESSFEWDLFDGLEDDFDSFHQFGDAKRLKSTFSGGLDFSSILYPTRPGRRGIKNVGNTCYLSAALQVLGHSGKIRKMLLEANFVQPNAVHENFVSLINQMWQDTPIESLDPSRLQQALFLSTDQRAFRIGSEEDAHEAVRWILGRLSDAANQKDAITPTLVDKTFSAKIQRPRLCHGCGILGGVVESEQDLLLPVPHSLETVSLYDCFARFGELESLPDTRCYTCGGDHTATIRSVIQEAGEVLLVFLKRFTQEGQKVHTNVALPLILQMQRINPSLDSLYNLVGIIHHHGQNIARGHYTSEFYHEQQNEWFYANDELVQSRSQPSSVSDTAYILVYERI
jgi:ubiquitin C-terminal hydrolase